MKYETFNHFERLSNAVTAITKRDEYICHLELNFSVVCHNVLVLRPNFQCNCFSNFHLGSCSLGSFRAFQKTRQRDFVTFTTEFSVLFIQCTSACGIVNEMRSKATHSMKLRFFFLLFVIHFDADSGAKQIEMSLGISTAHRHNSDITIAGERIPSLCVSFGWCCCHSVPGYNIAIVCGVHTQQTKQLELLFSLSLRNRNSRNSRFGFFTSRAPSNGPNTIQIERIDGVEAAAGSCLGQQQYRLA